MQSAATDFFASGGWVMSLAVILSCIAVLACLGKIVESLPSLLATLVRWKESDNINNAARLSRNRDLVCLALIPPFLLVATRYCLLDPLAQFPPLPRLGMTAAVFFGYLLFRLMLRLVCRPGIYDRKGWTSCVSCHYSFFALLCLLMLASVAASSLFGYDDKGVKTLLLWEIGGLYLLCLIRKLQLFVHYRGVFSGILYLCTLEIIPTGLLVAADILIQTWQ